MVILIEMSYWQCWFMPKHLKLWGMLHNVYEKFYIILTPRDRRLLKGGNVGRYKSLSNLHGDFPKNNHKFGSAPIATVIFRAWYKTHPPLSIDSFMLDISAFRTFFLRAFSCQCNYSFGLKYNMEVDNIFLHNQEQIAGDFDWRRSVL